jgi:hypothetical protein
MTRYRRDNSVFRASIARKCQAREQSLSTWQVLIVGLVVNLVKAYCFVLAQFGEYRAR